MNNMKFIILALLSMVTLNSKAADLVTFEEGDIIRSSDVNSNFDALNNELSEIKELLKGLSTSSQPSTGSQPGMIKVGNQVIFFGRAVSVPSGLPDTPDNFFMKYKFTVNFSGQFVEPPHLLFSPDIATGPTLQVTTSGFEFYTPDTRREVDYVAIGTLVE